MNITTYIICSLICFLINLIIIKLEEDKVTVGNFGIFILLSCIPVLNILITLYIIGIVFVNNFDKKLF